MASNFSPEKMRKMDSIKDKKNEIGCAIMEALRALDHKHLSVVYDHLEEAITKTLNLMDNDVQKKLFVSVCVDMEMNIFWLKKSL